MNPNPSLLLMFLAFLEQLGVVLKDWKEIVRGEEEKWMRLVRFESEIGINFAIGVLRAKLYANSVTMYGDVR